MSETRRTLLRLVANYGRLAATLVIGLTVTRLLIGEVGPHAFGLIVLLGASVGLVAMGREIVQHSLVRELGTAHHDGDAQQFAIAFNAAVAACLAGAGLAAAAFGALAAVVDLLRVPEELVVAARWFLLAKGVQLAVFIALAPWLNMYLVTERMVGFNARRVCSRAGELVAVAAIIAFPLSVPAAVIAFGAIAAALDVLVSVGFSLALGLRDRRLRFAPGQVTRAGIVSLLSLGKWNVITVVAMTLHVRVSAIVMNLFFGTVGNMLFGLGIQLTSYSRMVAMGMTHGLDAVSTRFSAGKGRAMGQLVYHATRLHGLVVFPAIAATVILAEPLLAVWVGPRLEDPEAYLPQAAALVVALALGIGVRAISDGWVRILYGAGFVQRYAWWILAGGVVNPVLAVTLILLLPEGSGYMGPALAFSAAMVVFHGVVIPAVGARCLEMSLWRLYRPLLRPAVATGLALPVLIIAGQWIEAWTLGWLALVGAVYGMVYGVLAAAIVPRPDDWRRIGAALRRQRPARSAG